MNGHMGVRVNGREHRQGERGLGCGGSLKPVDIYIQSDSLREVEQARTAMLTLTQYVNIARAIRLHPFSLMPQ